MKKTVVVLISILALLLSACTAILPSTPAPGPTVDTAGTSDALFKTAVALTLTAQPTLPVVSVTDTPAVAVESPVLAVTDTPTIPVATETIIFAPNLTTTPVTATSGVPVTNEPAIGTSTATLASNQATASPTLGIRTYGTLPPEVPFVHVTLVNKAKTEAYISLQVTMPGGEFSILEYPVEGTVKIKSPVGQYLYVAWVGGNKMVGNFRLYAGDDLVITLYKDKVTIK